MPEKVDTQKFMDEIKERDEEVPSPLGSAFSGVSDDAEDDYTMKSMQMERSQLVSIKRQPVDA